jgi:hypothetical protein
LLFLFFIFFIFEMEHPIPLISSTNLLASIIRAIPTSVVWNSVIVHHKPQGYVLNYYRPVGHVINLEENSQVTVNHTHLQVSDRGPCS